MKKIVIAITLLGTSIALFAQKHDYVWLMGYKGGNFNGPPGLPAGISLDFSDNQLKTDIEDRFMSFGMANIVMSDSAGQLLFYSNGCDIANASNEIMENGENINPGEVHELKCPPNGKWYTSGSQSMISLPRPGSSSLYDIFHQKIEYEFQPFNTLTTTLFQTVVDMNFNNGKGKVVLKNSIVLKDSLAGGELKAVKHANGKDWWVICPGQTNNKYYSLLLTANGITDTVTTKLGDPTDYYGIGGGQAVFTPDGSQYFRFNQVNKVRMFDFDRESGQLSNFQKIELDLLDFQGLASGCAVSPNSRFLYITTMKYLFQLDLEAADIGASVELIGEWDGSAQPFTSAAFYQCQLAPDCKIYINSTNGVDVMHVINKPNEKGAACEFVQNGIELPALNCATIPNFPNFRQGPLGVPYEVCDSTVQIFTPFFERAGVSIQPNPATTEFSLSIPQAGHFHYEILNLLGQVMKRGSVTGTSTIIETTDLPPGLFVVEIRENGRRLAVEKLAVE